MISLEGQPVVCFSWELRLNLSRVSKYLVRERMIQVSAMKAMVLLRRGCFSQHHNLFRRIGFLRHPISIDYDISAINIFPVFQFGNNRWKRLFIFELLLLAFVFQRILRYFLIVTLAIFLWNIFRILLLFSLLLGLSLHQSFPEHHHLILSVLKLSLFLLFTKHLYPLHACSQ